MGNWIRNTSPAKAATLFVCTLVGALAAGLAIYDRVVDSTPFDLTGGWTIEHEIVKTTYSPYRGLLLGYRIHLLQQGKQLTGVGEKRTENGQELPSEAFTPIRLSGTVKGRSVSGTFEEEGARRKTSGTFFWEVSDDGNSLVGSYSSTAASSSGPARGSRIPDG